jgi:hypothetical protein
VYVAAVVHSVRFHSGTFNSEKSLTFSHKNCFARTTSNDVVCIQKMFLLLCEESIYIVVVL